MVITLSFIAIVTLSCINDIEARKRMKRLRR